MNPYTSSRSRAIAEWVAVLARWLLGAFFVYMGMSKALHPVDFLKLVRQYELVESSLLLNSIAIILPWFEMFCGLLLLAGVAVRGAALMLVLMLVPFTVVVIRRALTLQAAQHIPFCAVKFDCGCGGGEVFICRKVLENLIFLGLSVWLVAGYGRRWCVRHTLRYCVDAA
jgi:uncharacterized membrane protein YphA (DoxX/SURF4 family)